MSISVKTKTLMSSMINTLSNTIVKKKHKLKSNHHKNKCSLFLIIGFLFSLFIPSSIYAATQTFAVPATSGSWVVPAGVTEIKLEARGGGGGADTNSSNVGGGGATVGGVFVVSPGDTIHYVVGEAGDSGPNEGGGGGSTGVFINNTLVIVAGGGGGFDNTENNGGNGLAAQGLATNVNALNTPQGSGSASDCVVVLGGSGGNGGNGGDFNSAGSGCNGSQGGSGGGGINSAGGNSFAANSTGVTGGGSAADLDPSDGLTVAAGGAATSVGNTGRDGGAGFTGGGGADGREGGGGGGYNGGAGANSSRFSSGGTSFLINHISGTEVQINGGEADSGDGELIIEYSTITFEKLVTNDNLGTSGPADFTLRLASTAADITAATAFNSGDVIGITSNATSNQYTLSEDAAAGYTETANTCAPLTHALADIGTDYTCTITNDDDAITPELTVVKSTGATGLLNADGTYTQEFTITLANTGNVTIANPTLVDDVEAIFTTAYDPSVGTVSTDGVIGVPSLTFTPSATNPGTSPTANATFDGDGANASLITGGSMNPGDSLTVTFTIELDATELSGATANTVTAGGTPPAGSTLVIDGEDAAGTDTADGTAGALTTPPTAVGSIALVKTSVFNDIDGTVGASVGDTITYTYTATNTSTVLNALNVTVTESAGSFTGNGTLPTPTTNNDGTTIDATSTLNDLAPGASLTWSATYAIVQADIDQGGVDNQAAVAAVDPFGNPLTDLSDDADVTGSDSTSTPLAINPSLKVTKIALASPTDLDGDGTFNQEFVVNVKNNGNVTITNPTLIDDIESTFTSSYFPSTSTANSITGIVIAPVVSGSTATGISGNTNYDGDSAGDASLITLAAGAEIAPGEEFTITFTADFDASISPVADGPVTNTATAGGTVPGTGPGSGPLTPVSDTAAIPADPNPELGVVKSAIVGPLQADGTFNVTYNIMVQNTGNLALDPLTLVDKLTDTDQLGNAFNGVVSAPVVSGSALPLPSPNPLYNGDDVDELIIGTDGRITPSQLYEVVFTVNVDPNADGAPTDLQNSATATGTPPTGPAVTDDSNTGTDATGASTGETPNTNPGGAGVPTPLTPPTEVGTIGLVKSAVLNDDDGTPGVSAGDTITYTYVVTNTSSIVNVLNVNVTESGVAPDFTGTGIPPVPALSSGGSDLDSGNLTATDLAVGDTVTFTASYILTQADIDAGMVDNSAEADATDPAGNDLTDVSDDGTGGSGTNGTGAGNDDPTSVLFGQVPAIEVVKSASVGTLKADGTVDVVFTLVTENTGNVTLSNLTLFDDLQTQFGSAFKSVVAQPTVSGANATGSTAPAQTTSYNGSAVSGLIGTGGALAVGDTYTVVFTVNVDMNAAGAPSPLANTATAGGTGPGSTTPVTDDSNNDTDGTNNDGTDGTAAGTGVPTIIALPTEEGTIGLVKSSVLNDDDGTPGISVGDTITYTYVVTNTSDIVNVFNVNVTESGVAPAFTGTGTAPVPVYASGGSDLDSGNGTATDLAVGETVTFTASYILTAADIAAGKVDNTAEAAGTDSSGNDVTDTSDSGNPADGDGSGTADGNDPTSTPLVITPMLEVLKSASVGTLKADGTIDVVFTLVTTNTGNVTMSNLTLVDDLVTQFGSAFNVVTVQPIVSGATATGSTAPTQTTAYDGSAATGLIGTGGVLVAGDSYTVVFTVNTDPFAENAPSPLANTATTGGDDPTGTTLTDDSANSNDPSNDGADGTDPDATDSDTAIPTLIELPTELGAIGLVKSAVLNDDDGTAGISAGDTIDYTYVVTNTSDFVSVFNVNVTEPAGGFTGTGPAPTPVYSTGGSDLDAGVGTPTDLAVGETVTFVGSYTLTQADIDAGKVDNSARADATGPAGNAVSDTSDSGNSGEGNGDGTGTPGSGPGNDDPTSIGLSRFGGDIPDNAVLITKRVNKSEVSAGDQLYYVIEVENQTADALSTLDIRDDLPAGFSIASSTAKLTRAGADNEFGTADDVVETIAADGTDPITFTPLVLVGNEKVQIGYIVRVGATVTEGEATNKAQAFGEGSDDIASNLATATVTVNSNSVLDQSTLIGKVFHDRDGDGYQDDVRVTGITVKSDYFGWNSLHLGGLNGRVSILDDASKYRKVIRMPISKKNDFRVTTQQGTVIIVDNNGQVKTAHRGFKARGLTAQDLRVTTRKIKGMPTQTAVKKMRVPAKVTDVLEITITNHGIQEEGIPGVRLGTVEGLLIETDSHGRYHIPDVDGGRRDSGKNFIIKLDISTIPRGSRLTTENPRVMRLTGAALNKINFGVKLPTQQQQAPHKGGHAHSTVKHSATEQRSNASSKANVVEVALEDNFFVPNAATILPKNKPALDEIVSALILHNGGQVIIKAGQDNRSIVLAKARANSVRKLLHHRLGNVMGRVTVIAK